jgi:Phosphate transporter family/Transposase IS116/IS110/IS902 family
LARELFSLQAKEYAQLQAQVDEVDAKLMAWHKADECSRRLAKIPGVGPIGAVLLKMKTPEPELFRSGRQFAAWIGLTPKDHSTAGKVRLGVITRAGDEGLRVHTVGSKITKLTPMQGFCAETGGAITLFLATGLGIPVSTTHTITGAIVGVGAARRVSAVRWNIAKNIVVAWVITMPMAGVIAAIFYVLARSVG